MHAFLCGSQSGIFLENTYYRTLQLQKAPVTGLFLFCLENIILTLEHNNAEEWSEEIIL